MSYSLPPDPNAMNKKKKLLLFSDGHRKAVLDGPGDELFITRLQSLPAVCVSASTHTDMQAHTHTHHGQQRSWLGWRQRSEGNADSKLLKFKTAVIITVSTCNKTTMSKKMILYQYIC